ncbi:MAG: RHS repeat protein, partial [Gammaproteobacteria bacterium]|nr:RHS repeat protein [Gammaproteobacteria bacterium]NIR84862.1 RHS repeat protein [Gammaproteobacteria bacterium]NIR91687.1 RHS repeat protein [Gammaproteobacteria bacterium]NIU05909.1 RHS repeat protein [Gammaproteobacteria bacterium]NIV52956.1 hypothetical protein [Gammaproteobacteria bacterium]
MASGLCLAGLLLAEGLSAPGAHSAVTNQGKEPRWQTWSEACEAVLAFWGGSAWRLVPRTNPAINGRPGPHGYTCQTLTPRGWIRRSTLWAICGPGERGSLIAEDGCAPKGASPKNLGAISCPPLVGNPIHAGTGNKFQTETDYRGAGPRTLRFVRYYNSLSERASPFFGLNWRSNFDRSLFATPRPRVHVFRPDGQELVFTPAGGGWRSDPDVTARLLERADGWEYIDADDTVERYDVKGRLQSIRTRDGYTQTLTWEGKKISTVSDAHGRALRFAYADGRLVSVTDPEGRVTTYGYDARSNLSTVTYPDDTPEDLADNPTRRYHYENPDYPHHLTGITDANGDRFATWAYDAQGRAVLSEHAGGADRLSVTYTTDGSAVLTD